MSCVLWTGGITSAGYGSTLFEGRIQQAHRVYWQLLVGPIPKGLHVLHKCDVKRCVNINHLFLGTHADNMCDMKLKGRAWSPNKYKTKCPSGHSYTKSNTYVSKGGRKCRTCVLARMKVQYARSK